TTCLSNDNQIGKSVMLYMGVNDDRFPLMMYKFGTGAPQTGADPMNSVWYLDTLPFRASWQILRCPSDAQANDRDLSVDAATGAVTVTQRDKEFAWAMRANHGYNYQYLSPELQLPGAAGNWGSPYIQSLS